LKTETMRVGVPVCPADGSGITGNTGIAALLVVSYWVTHWLKFAGVFRALDSQNYQARRSPVRLD